MPLPCSWGSPLPFSLFFFDMGCGVSGYQIYPPRQNWAPTGLSAVVRVVGLSGYGEWRGMEGPPEVSNSAMEISL